MAKQKDNESGGAPPNNEPTMTTEAPKKYRIKGGADAIQHPVLGTITKDHMANSGETFARAMAKCHKDKRAKAVDAYLEEVK